MRMLSTALAVFAALGFVGCGGGSDVVSPVGIGILSTPALDGHVTATGSVSTGDVVMAAGDSVTGDIARFFVSFPLGAIPAGAQIQSASIEMTQVNVLGTPYLDLGGLALDHMDYGPSLEFGDFGLGALSPAFALLSTTPALGLRTVDVKPQLQADIVALRTRSQYRCRFGATTDGNADDDFVQFNTNEAPSDKPVLVVFYLP